MKLVADFANWNHRVMKRGVLPKYGFYDEEFPARSARGKRAGERIMGKYCGVFIGNQADGKARVPCVPKSCEYRRGCVCYVHESAQDNGCDLLEVVQMISCPL